MATSKLHTPSLRERLISETVDAADLGELQGLGSRATSFMERSRIERTFAPLNAGGIRQSVFVLVQTALGGGVLTIAYMLKISGPIMGIWLLFAGAIVAFVSMDVLMKSAVLLHRYTFGALLSYALGPKSGIFLDLMLFLYGNGSLITYFIFLGDFVPSLYIFFMGLSGEVLDHTSHDYDELRTHCLVAMFLLVVIPSLPRDLSAFRFLSPIMLIAILYTEGLVCYTCVSLIHTKGWSGQLRDAGVEFPSLEQLGHELLDISGFIHNIGSVCKAFSISVFAYCCHLNVVPVAKELTNPEDRRIEKICWRVAALQLVIYLILAGAGYLAFGAGTPQNLLQAFPSTDYAALASRCLMTLTVLVAVATNTNPTVRALLCLVEVKFESLRDRDYGKSPEELQQSPPPKRPGQNGVSEEEPSKRKAWRYFFSICCLLMDTCVAVMVRDVATVIGVLGATMGNVMMMVIPLLLLYLLRDELYDSKGKTIAIAVILVLAGIFASASMFIS